jgi:hypothetical protein
MNFGTVILDSGKFGEEYRYPLNGGTSTSLDRCFYKVIFEGKIKEECREDPSMGGTGLTCAFVLRDVKRTDECQCSPMFCGDPPSVATEEVSIHLGGLGFEFKFCRVFPTLDFCPPIPQINWCTGKKTTDIPYMRIPSNGFGYHLGSCTSKNGTTQAPLVNLWTRATGSCEKLLANALSVLVSNEAAGSGGAVCPGPTS